MNYASTARRPNPAAMLGALGVPAAFGAILVAGLAVTVVLDPPEDDVITWDIPEEKPIIPPPPPEDTKVEQTTPSQQAQTPQVIDIPKPEIELTSNTDFAIESFPPLSGDPLLPTGPTEIPSPTVAPSPALPDPIAASPRNAPGRWITDSDYKSRWIREGLEGRARFNLEISAKGRVTQCSVIGSTGHTELDAATCRLIARRARFKPAKDSYGNTVSGSFSSAVNWQIPD